MTAISVSNSLTLWPGEHKEQQWLTTPAAHALEHDVTHDSSWKIWFIAIALWARSATVETKSSVKWCWRAASGQQRVKRRRATIKYNKMEKWAIQWKILVSIGCDMNTQSTCHDRQRTVETAQVNAVTRRRRHNIKSNSIAIEKFHYILSTTQFSNFFFVGLHWLYSLSDCCIESILSFSVGFFFSFDRRRIKLKTNHRQRRAWWLERPAFIQFQNPATISSVSIAHATTAPTSNNQINRIQWDLLLLFVLQWLCVGGCEFDARCVAYPSSVSCIADFTLRRPKPFKK